MCRFSVSNAPPPQPASPGLEQLLDDDDFSWFDAIADLPDEQIDNAAVNYQTEVAVARSSDSSDNGHSNNNSSPSDTSSYDLMELFKQQVEQDPAVLMATANVQAQYGFAPFPATSVLEPTMAPGMTAALDLNMTAFTASLTAPSGIPTALAAVAPAMAMPAAPSSCAPSEAAHGLNNMAMNVPNTPSVVQAARKAGKHQKTQQEQEAAIERIKQKRRESAQRSRARKNDYMRQLEVENQGLKDEIHRLQSMVQALQRKPACNTNSSKQRWCCKQQQ